MTGKTRQLSPEDTELEAIKGEFITTSSMSAGEIALLIRAITSLGVVTVDIAKKLFGDRPPVSVTDLESAITELKSLPDLPEAE